MIPAFLNYILIYVLKLVYGYFCYRYTEFENHKTLNSYEFSFIAKKMTFEFSIFMTPLILIAFYNKDYYKCSVWNEIC